MSYGEKIEYNGYKIIIRPDEDAPDPRREFDNFGIMVTAHRRYELGDAQIGGKFYQGKPWFPDVDEFYAFMKRQRKGVFLPLYLYDHSSITMTVSSAEFRAADSHGWDWGIGGYIYATAEMIKKEYGVKKITPEIQEKVKKLLVSEVHTYDMYLTGDVWGYEYFAPPPGYAYDKDEDEFLDGNGEPFVGYWDSDVDSCWGFYGYSYVIQEAKDQVDWHIQYTAEKELAAALQIENMHHKLFYELEGVGL